MTSLEFRSYLHTQCRHQEYAWKSQKLERCYHRQTLAQYYRHSVVGIVLYAVTLAVPIATDLAC